MKWWLTCHTNSCKPARNTVREWIPSAAWLRSNRPRRRKNQSTAWWQRGVYLAAGSLLCRWDDSSWSMSVAQHDTCVHFPPLLCNNCLPGQFFDQFLLHVLWYRWWCVASLQREWDLVRRWPRGTQQRRCWSSWDIKCLSLSLLNRHLKLMKRYSYTFITWQTKFWYPFIYVCCFL